MEPEYDITVVGAGPAGLLAAARAAESGARTALVAPAGVGGMAVADGPVPVRTLAHVARLLRDAKQLSEYGISVKEPELDYPRMLERVRAVVADVGAHSSLQKYFKSRDGVVYDNIGPVHFVNEHEIESGGGERLRSDKFIICTGGVSRPLPIPGFEFTSTHSDAWGLTGVPSSMIVVGAGATGIQVASVFNAFGTQVQVFEAGPRILPTEDSYIAAAVADAFGEAGITVRQGFGAIDSFEKTPTGVRMNLTHDGTKDFAEADVVVVAVGWRADTQNLNLSAAGVELTDRGFVKVDDHLRTSTPNIYAAGDVTGRIMLASEAIRDGFVAATNAARGNRMPLVPHVVPAGSFTDPEYASVGLTEEAARKSYDVEVAVQKFSDTTRPIIDGRTFGFCKLVIDKATNEVLGCHVVGDRAVDIVQIASVALSAGMKRVDRLAQLEVSYPSYAQLLVFAAINASLKLGIDIGVRPDLGE